MVFESSRLAELKHAISAAWDVRKKLTTFDRAIWTKNFPRSRWHIFFTSFLPSLSAAPYLQYAPAIPVCSILQPCVSARQKSECRGLLDPRNTWTCTNDAWAYWIQIDRRKSTIHERSVRTERQEGLLTDRLTIDFFRLEKDGTFFSFCFFSIPLLQPCTFLAWRAWSSRAYSERQFFFDAAIRPLWRWKTLD